MKNIFVAGHNGMVGSAICRTLENLGEVSLLTADRESVDLTSQACVHAFFDAHRIDEVYLAAAKVGGIHANNTYPAEFIYDNLMIQTNVIHAAFSSGVKKLLFLGSSCIYPRLAAQPMAESELFNGKLESTNEAYAIAKIAGIKLCESYNRQYGRSHGVDFRSVMPTNLYGPGDNYHAENSHVIPALIRRFHEAKTSGREVVKIWGSGRPLREFLYVDDLATACVYVMGLEEKKYLSQTEFMCSHLNIGSGSEISISDLAKLIAKTVGYNGLIEHDISMQDGTPRKLMDSSRIAALGWRSSMNLESGLVETYNSFLKTGYT